MSISIEKIPACLRDLPQWVLWKIGERKAGDKPTKLPFQVNGLMAKANDPGTWTSFDAVFSSYHCGGYSGIGFEFSTTDPFCGVDLDGCRDPKTGAIAEWAREIIRQLATYSEVSPSGTGVKMFLRAKSPFEKGRKKELPDKERVSDKNPAIEIYDWGRYFAVTGLRLAGLSSEPEPRQAQLEEIIEEYFPNEFSSVAGTPVGDFRSDEAVFERARKYLAKMPPAISGQDGHGRTFRVACVLVIGFDLPEAAAMTLMHEFNQTCQPQWNEKELLHKVRCAAKQPGERGYLRNTSPDRWSAIRVPEYQEPAAKHEPRETTLIEATRAYVNKLRTGESGLITLGIGDLDYAIGGGVEKGEMVILAARPSHGKSAVGLQCIHHWTHEGRPCAIVSEEMAALALGKRTLQFVTAVPQEHWFDLVHDIDKDVEAYGQSHAPCVVLEGCGTADAAREAIERSVRDHKVECVVVDYAQLLGAAGKDRYQQMTSMSVTLRQLASSQKIVLLALCQMSRAIESRSEFVPVASDLKETGQLEQDADVIIFLCWPHRLNQNEPENKFQFFVRKNRNRAINQTAVVSRFVPARQQILDALPEFDNERAYRGH